MWKAGYANKLTYFLEAASQNTKRIVSNAKVQNSPTIHWTNSKGEWTGIFLGGLYF